MKKLPKRVDTDLELNRVDHTRMFVSLLTVRVLSDCNFAQELESTDRWIEYCRTIIDRVMEGITDPCWYIADVKGTKNVSKAAIYDLKKEFGTKQLLEAALARQTPSTIEVLAQILLQHTKLHFKKIQTSNGGNSFVGGFRSKALIPLALSLVIVVVMVIV